MIINAYFLKVRDFVIQICNYYQGKQKTIPYF